MSKVGMLDSYLFFNSNEKTEVADRIREVGRLINAMPKEELHGGAHLYLVKRWNEDKEMEKEDLISLLGEIKDFPDELYNNLDVIADYLAAWSKSMIVDETLDELAKYVMAVQLNACKPFILELGGVKESQKKPAHRPRKKNFEFCILILMEYYQIGSISGTATKLNMDRQTIKRYLKIIIGDEYRGVENGTHPEYKKILMAYDIWSSKQK